MKKIWLVYPYGQVYGEKGRLARYNLFGLELSKKNYQVIWWTANFNHTEKEYRSEGWKTINVNKNYKTILIPTFHYKKNVSIGRLIFENKYARGLGRVMSKYSRPDLIIIAGTGIFNAFEPCFSYAKKNNIPIIYDIMDIPLIESYFRRNNKIIAPIAKVAMAVERKREKRFFDYIQGVTGLGKNQLQYALGRVGNRKVQSELVYNGNDVKRIRTDMAMHYNTLNLNKDKDWVWCLFIGALGPSYDIDTIIKCADKCLKNHDKIKFLIAGDGPQKNSVIEASSRNSNLKYMGFLSMEELAELYSYGDIGLCAFSDFSTVDMPDKFYDYCAAGLAVINSLKGEVKDYINNSHLGLQYKAGDADDLYKKVVELSNRTTLSICKSNAYKIGMKFDIDNQMEKMSAFVDSILEKS